ncbi:MAG: hypothetical protein JWQ87_5406 [Candidatus Sulfotelmatobacter sp.]|nr:hypothetical protein [Candidatus Sulfotelmatobacter sp.]
MRSANYTPRPLLNAWPIVAWCGLMCIWYGIIWLYLYGAPIVNRWVHLLDKALR